MIPHRDLGDGPPCPEPSADGERHGNTYDMGTCFWCPVDGFRFRRVDSFTAGERLTRTAATPQNVRSTATRGKVAREDQP